MTRIKKTLAITVTWIMVAQPWMAQITAAAPVAGSDRPATGSTTGPRELTGFLDDRTAEFRAARDADRKAGFGEDGSRTQAPPLASLPIVDAGLAEKLRVAKADETVRVIIHLDYQPHAMVFEEVTRAHKDEIEAIDRDRAALTAPMAKRRNAGAETDRANYADLYDLSDAEREQLRAVNERHEALSTRIKDQTATELKQLLDAYQAPLKSSIAELGGEVEFTTIAGNLVVATMPAAAVASLADQPGVMRVVEDSVMHGHLDVADEATMVDPTDTGLLGLWDMGHDGGIYDAAIIDSGLDLSHPAMADNAGRANFSSWYVVAAVGSTSYAETCCNMDDWQGHGTHVAGIVGSYGTRGEPQYLGMAHGAEKLVSLKAGWLNTSGLASMFWSDKYNLVDRALYNTDALSPANSFLDDVDGMNLSYGGSTTLDDTDGGRFWDSVISTFQDLPVTISAGNSGPSNTIFNDPATSYNAIVVGNAQDQNTADRSDDTMRSSSTRGPTASGRRKPDLAAYGTSIMAPNHAHEFSDDFVSKSGTSMAAPMVLGVAMDLMDAGVFDEKAIKAVLINSAKTNIPGINNNSDADGWDPASGWGVMDAYSAYYHRFDYFLDYVAPRNQAGDYQLYKGVMRDEGAAGDGRDRATMVWNRHATYDAAAAPGTYYVLSDLNMRLYAENDNFLIDDDLSGLNNVHQVRIGAGAGDTDVVINAYAWASAFNHGGANEHFALATEEGFERVDLPSVFQGIAIWPTSVEPNEEFDIEFWLRNDSEIASHNNEFELSLAAGWTLVSGIVNQNVGSAAGGGGNTAHVTYTIRAPTFDVGAQTIVVKHRHSSYNEQYGDFNWNMGLNVEWDNTSPTPDPMSFSTVPFATGTDAISMTASFASDTAHNPVEYYLDYTSSPSGGPGGSDSGWQASRSYIDDGLSTNHEYCYRSWAQDSATFPNLTDPSPILCAYTLQAVPNPVSIGLVTSSSITVSPGAAPANLTLGASGLRIADTTSGDDSGWQQSTADWVHGGLGANTAHTYVVRARNGDGIDTADSTPVFVHTLANIPAVDALVPNDGTSIKVALNPNGNAGGTEYLIENTTAGTSSGWTATTSWLSDGLACETFYNFQARARNGDGIETIIVPLGLAATGECVALDTDDDGIDDSVDNCTLVANPAQRDTDVDGYGNFCDGDLNNDLFVNFADLALFKTNWLVAGDLDTDINGDGLTNFGDLALIKGMFLAAPGPSGLAP